MSKLKTINLKILLLMLILGILIGFGISVIYTKLTETKKEATKSWHYVTSFVIASYDPFDFGLIGEYGEVKEVKIAYSYPKVYNVSSPSFTIKGDIWRLKWETIPYYNVSFGPEGEAILYYAYFRYKRATPSLIPAFQVLQNNGIITEIEVLSPRTYNATLLLMSADEWIFCATPSFYNGSYVPVKSFYTTITSGPGTYYISAQGITGCFNFTIEEYY
jgi:hypothetical protein